MAPVAISSVTPGLLAGVTTEIVTFAGVGAFRWRCVVRARPIGVLNLEDEHGGDEKLICVPVDSTFPYYSDIGEQKDLPSIVLAQIEHFFTHYKDLEPEKWVRIGKWGDADDARRVVLECIERYNAAK